MANYNAADWDGFKDALSHVSSVTDTITLTGTGYIYSADDDYTINASFTVVLGAGVSSASFKSSEDAKFTITGGTQIWNGVTFELSDGSACAVTGAAAACDVTFNDCTFQDSAGNGLGVSANTTYNVTVTANRCLSAGNVSNGFRAWSASSGDVLLTCTDCTSHTNDADGFNNASTLGQTGTCDMVLTGCTSYGNGTSTNDQAVTSHVASNITATDCDFYDSFGPEFAGSGSGTHIFTRCTFTASATQTQSCIYMQDTGTYTFTDCTIVSKVANLSQPAVNIFAGATLTATFTNCSISGPAQTTAYSAGTAALVFERCRLENAVDAAVGVMCHAAQTSTLTLRNCTITQNNVTSNSQMFYAYAGTINVIGCAVNNVGYQTVGYCRGGGSLNLLGSRVIVNGAAAAVKLRSSNALFNTVDTGTLRARGNLINIVGATGTNSTERYVFRFTPESGTTAPLLEIVGNVIDIPKFYTTATQKWYVALVGTYSSGTFVGNEIYGDGVTLCGEKASATGVVVAGNVFHNLLVGVTVTNDNQYGTQSGCGANVFSECGTNVSGGTPALANGDQVLHYQSAGRYINDKSFRNAHKRIGGGI